MNNTIQNAAELPVVVYRFSVHGKADKSNVRSMSEEITEQAGAEKDTVTTLVRRVPKCFAGPLKTAEGQIRNLFYKRAIQFGDCFAVPVKAVPAFKSELSRLEQEYGLHLSRLVEAAENGTLQQTADAQLADLKDKVTVPTAAEIREGYGVEVRTYVNFDSATVTGALAILSDDLRTALKADVEASLAKDNAEKLASANEKVVGAVRDFLKDVQERCGKVDPKGIQFKTLVDKARNVIDNLPAYNLTGDPELAALIESVRTKFDGLNKEVLKADPQARQKAVDGAAEIRTNFAKLF